MNLILMIIGVLLFILLIAYRYALATRRVEACVKNKTIISITKLDDQFHYTISDDLTKIEERKIAREINIYANPAPFAPSLAKLLKWTN